MTIDISKIRPGDEVTARLKVKAVESGSFPIRVTLGGDSLLLSPTEIIEHTPTELQPGDRVKSRFDGAEYEIVAGPRQRKDGAIEVALWSDELGFFDSALSNLERV